MKASSVIVELGRGRRMMLCRACSQFLTKPCVPSSKAHASQEVYTTLECHDLRQHGQHLHELSVYLMDLSLRLPLHNIFTVRHTL